MLCPHCNSQWQLPGDNKIQITSCPFCNENLYAELKEPYTTDLVLREIRSRFGTDIFSDSDDLISAFTCLAPKLEKEKQGFLFFEACGGFDNFFNIKGATSEKVTEIYNNQIKQMTEVISDVWKGLLAASGISAVIDTSEIDKTQVSTSKWEYANLGNDTIEIIACKDQLSSEIVFPCYIDGKKVVSIGSTVFGLSKTKGADRLRVESVFVPQGVTSIKSGAFSGCKSLKIISLPKGLLSIGDEVFKNCKVLTSISIPDSVIYIGSGAFSGSGIQSFVWPNGIEVVSKEAFKNCKKLLNITILGGVTTIQTEAFSGCNSLTSIVLPNGVKTIEALAFYECKKLNRVILPDTLECIGRGAFENCSSLTAVNIPEKVKELEYAVFYGCGFSSFIVPDHIIKIDDDAFANCWSLTKITIPDSVIEIHKDALFNTLINARVACFENSVAHKWAQKNKINFEFI